jgi:hypothetical protein
MNIFYLDNNPTICAQMHNDKHVIKMILESAQLLSTAHRVLDGVETIGLSQSGRKKKIWKLADEQLDSQLYSATHQNHPSAIWVRQSIGNYNWLALLLANLCAEYTYRYGKVHKCQESGLVALLLVVAPKNISKKPFNEPTPAMPADVIVEGSSLASYRNYYINNKQHLASWSGKINSRRIPEWFNAQLRF